MSRFGSTVALAACALILTSCGDGDSASTAAGSGAKPEIVVFAASSLQPAFEAYAKQFPAADIAYSFAGSDTLAAQMRQGLEPDVFAAANTTYPEQLHAEGLLEQPVVFAANELVLAVPIGSEIESVDDAAEPGLSVAIGAEGVPVGDYTRDVLGALPDGEGEEILANVASEEPDVAGIVGKLTQGAVDAGFVYRSDVAAAGGDLDAIALSRDVSPDVAYGAGVGGGAAEPGLAQQFLDGLLVGAGAEALADNEFGPPRRGGTG